MASKQAGKDAMAFIVSALTRNKDVAYADVRSRAEEQGFTIYPIMFGRAKALLGLVKVAKPGEGKQRKAARAADGSPENGRRRKGGAAPKAGGGKKRGGRTQEGSSKSGQIRGLLRSGMAPMEIAKKVGCSVNLVYKVRGRGAGKAGRERTAARGGAPRGQKQGRPPKVSSNGSVDSVVDALRAGERERAQLLKAIEQIRAIVEGVA